MDNAEIPAPANTLPKQEGFQLAEASFRAFQVKLADQMEVSVSS